MEEVGVQEEKDEDDDNLPDTSPGSSLIIGVVRVVGSWICGDGGREGRRQGGKEGEWERWREVFGID